MVEQRHHAVLAVIADGRAVKEVATQWAVSRHSVHAWLSRYEAGGLEGLADRSHRPGSCRRQLAGEVVALVSGVAAGQPVLGSAAAAAGADPPRGRPAAE